MTNRICEGEVFNVLLSGTVAAGEVVEFADLIGVAVSGGVSGDLIAVEVEGVFNLAKTTGEVFLQGQKLYWDKSTNKLTTDPDPAGSPGRAIFAGYAYSAAALNDTTAEVKLPC